MTGKTHFNADLAGAELLAVADKARSIDIRSRRNLAANIKVCLFNGAVRIEGKNKTAFTFRACWRILIALNDEPEALLVLPPITEDFGDKITLFKCHRRPLRMPAFTLDQQQAFFETLKAELPGLLQWLEDREIPEELKEERCGVKAYHHPAILHGLHELSREADLFSLISLIDTAEGVGSLPLPWEGTAAQLKGMGLDSIRVFAITKLAWIRREQKKMREQEREAPREFLERECHYVWGKCAPEPPARNAKPSWRNGITTKSAKPFTRSSNAGKNDSA